MRGGDEREGVGVIEQCGLVLHVVEKFCDRKMQAVPTAEAFVAEVRGSPRRIFVGEHGEAGDGAVVGVEDAVVIDEHPALETVIDLALDLDVHA